MKKLLLTALIAGLFAGGSLLLPRPVSAADYSNSNMIDDAVFNNVGTMNAAQIQAFLQSKNSTCLQNYTDVDFNWNGTSWVYSGTATAAQIIYKVAQEWGINPQVILATLQKEESLVTGTTCTNARYTSAMGYGCPDAGVLYDYPDIGVMQTCVSRRSWAGFTRQVLWGSYQLEFNMQRSEGNTSWNGDTNLVYSGYMTAGSRARCATCTVNTYDGYATIDGQSIYLSNGATASLYSYTPHLNQSFPGIFENWFGSVLSNAIGPTAYRLYSGTGDHIYTAKALDRSNALASGFRDDAVAFNVSATQVAGTLPVYALYNGRLSDHYLTFDGQNRYWALIYGGYRDDGIAFYAYPTVSGSTSVVGACPAGSVPVYSMWSSKIGDHFYTTSGPERYWVFVYAGYRDDLSSSYIDRLGNGSVGFCASP